MTETTDKEQGEADRALSRPDHLFKPGQSGNPEGRPKGSRNKATLLLDQLGRENAKDILQNIIDRAKDGDNFAANLVLNRVWPARKANTVQIELPIVETAADVTKALDTVLAAVAAGEIDPDEAVRISAVLEIKRRSIELVEMEQRVKVLEERSR